jgi:aminoglycoside N3'-acetyltransferase
VNLEPENIIFSVNQGAASGTKQMVKSSIELGMPLMVHALVYKFRIICLNATKVIQRRPEIFLFFAANQ